MKALVTGGGGFLGRYIVEQLLARGDTVSILARGHYPGLAVRGVTCHQGELTDPGLAVAACDGVDAVFHVAAKADFWGHPDDFRRVNVTGTEVLLTASQAQGVGKFIYTSTPSVVFGGEDLCGVDESTPYPAWYLGLYPETKAIAEQIVLANNGINGQYTCALRPHLIWGPDDPHLLPRLLARARRGRLVQVGTGKNRVDMTYVDNAAAAHLLAAENLRTSQTAAGQAYFISDGVPVVLWDWVAALLRELNLPPVRRHVSYRTAYAAGAILECASRLLPGHPEPPMTRFVAGQLAHDHWFDLTAARRDLGYAPPVPPEEAMARTLAWLRSSHY